MGEAKDGIKDLRHPFLGNHRLMFTCGFVAEDCTLAELDVLKVKAGDGCFVGGDFFQGGLIRSQLMIVMVGMPTAEMSDQDSASATTLSFHLM